MRIHGNSWMAIGGVQNHVGGFATHARKGFELRAILRNFAVVFVYQDLAGFHYVRSFGVKQTNGLDVIFHSGQSKRIDRLWRVGFSEQRAGGFVYAHVGCLRRQHDCD